VSLRSEFCVAMSVTISALIQCSIRLYLQLFVVGLMSYLRYLCLFEYSSSNTYCVVFFFFLCAHLLSVSLDCPFCIALRYSLTFIYIISSIFFLLMVVFTLALFTTVIRQLKIILTEINYLTFKSFGFEHTWWRLFQKRVVCTNITFLRFYYYHWVNTSAVNN
jgi:hypothetical protein